ncbi:citrate transporter domain-containing protein [Phthorimaea operculella]|nr:citrate transporter domain-containing protein [Phthorimaea operculella]
MDLFSKTKKPKNRKVRDSIYSVVSCSDLTPGSVEVWRDLPEDIKFDPVLEPFKRLYETCHGKLESVEFEKGGKVLFSTNADLKDKESEAQKTLDDEDLPNGDNRLLETKHTIDDGEPVLSKPKKIHKTLRIIKLTALVASWIILTVALLLNQENEDVVLHTAVVPGEDKVYDLNPAIRNGRVAISVSLTGPFTEDWTNDTQALYISLQRTVVVGNSSLEQTSVPVLVFLQPDNSLDFGPSFSVSKTLVLDIKSPTNDSKFDAFNGNGTKTTLRMSVGGNTTVPLTLSYHMDPVEEAQGVAYAAILLGILYVLIIFEIINRTISAILVSTLAVAVLAMCGVRPTLPELISWLDVETLLLLFSMMLIVAMVAETGLFDCLAVFAFEVTGGKTWPLITCLCIFTAVFSSFLDNVTTMLLITPITIRLCEVMQLNPKPVLISMVIFSNIGGSATPVGDPPNVIIASQPAVLNANINFMTFTIHMGVGILLVSVQTYIQLRLMFRDMSKLKHSIPTHLLEMQQEIAAWRRAAASLSTYSKDEDIVKRALEKKVEKLNFMLVKLKSGKIPKSASKFSSTLEEMKQKYCIRNKELLIKCTICVTFVVLAFFFHAFPAFQSLSLGWTALLGAMLLLLLAEADDLEPILARVEWSTLLFFAALFVLMEALSKLGLIAWIGNLTQSLIASVGEESRLAVAIMLVLWISGLTSAFVDNIPLTTMMVRVTTALSDPNGLGLPLAPLVWALSFGACLGGNGTLIGASANVVCAGVSEQHGYKISFIEYIKIGFPIMMGNLIVASGYLLFCHCVFEWH